MALMALLIRYCTFALPLLVSSLAVVASALLLASGSASKTEIDVLRIATQTLFSVTIADLVLLVGLLGWNSVLLTQSSEGSCSTSVSSHRAE